MFCFNFNGKKERGDIQKAMALLDRKDLAVKSQHMQEEESSPSIKVSMKSPLSGRRNSSGSSSWCTSESEMVLSYLLPNGDIRTVSLKDKHSVTIGRNEESDICIATTICSRDHAVVSLDENGNAWAKNLSETNPCKLNGVKVSMSTRVQHGDVLEVGGVSISFGNTSAILARRQSKFPSSPMQKIKLSTALEGILGGSSSSSSTELSGEEEGYETVSTENATTSPDSADEEQSVLMAVASISSPHGSMMLARKIMKQKDAFKTACTPERAEEQSVATAVASASSPVGSKLLARKIMSQRAAANDPSIAESTEEQSIAAAVGSFSSPTGSKLLARKIHSQKAIKAVARLDMSTATGYPSNDSDHNFDGSWSVQAHEQAPRQRATHNRRAHSPSMGVSEEEHKALQAQYEASSEMAASPSASFESAEDTSINPPTPSTPKAKHHLSCGISSSIYLFTTNFVVSSPEASLNPEMCRINDAMDRRRIYNQTVYSPSMGMTEKEVAAHRAEDLNSIKGGNAESSAQDTPCSSIHAHASPESARKAYNQLAHSPSMGASEEELQALRMVYGGESLRIEEEEEEISDVDHQMILMAADDGEAACESPEELNK